MPNIDCPWMGCTFSTGEVEAIVAVALLNAHVTEHVNPTTTGQSQARPPPVDRPRLQAASPKAEWEIFSSKWRSFKAATNLSADKVVHQLLGCLEGDLANLVYNKHATPETLEEEELLGLIEKVAIKLENIWVTREKLHSMKQDQGEPVTSFAARLKGQARLCGFKKTVKCTRPACDQNITVDFTETVVIGDIVRGLADPEIKAIVLGEVEQKSDLTDLITLIQAKEYGRLSSCASPSINTVISSVTPSGGTRKCSNCGRQHKLGSN